MGSLRMIDHYGIYTPLLDEELTQKYGYDIYVAQERDSSPTAIMLDIVWMHTEIRQVKHWIFLHHWKRCWF